MTAVYYPCIRSCPLFLSYFFVTLAPKPMLKTAKEMLQPGAGGRTDESERIQKAKTMLSWIRPRGELYVSVWCQADQTGWDTYAGPKFVVEFQLGREPVIGKSEIRRARIGKMLSAAEREDIRTIQNSVIASLRRPPKSHALLNPGEKLSAWYLKRFKSIDQPL